MFWNTGSSQLTVLIIFTLLYDILFLTKGMDARRSRTIKIGQSRRKSRTYRPTTSTYLVDLLEQQPATICSEKGKTRVLPGKTRVHPSRLEIYIYIYWWFVSSFFFFLSSLDQLKLAGKTFNSMTLGLFYRGLSVRSAGGGALPGCSYCCEPPQPTTNSTCRLNMACSDIMWHTYHPPSLDSKLRPGSQLPPSMTPGAQAIERMALSRAVGSRRKHPRRASWTPTSPEPWKITLSHLIFTGWLILVDRFPYGFRIIHGLERFYRIYNSQ